MRPLELRGNEGMTLLEMMMGFALTAVLMLAGIQTLVNSKSAEMSTAAYKDFLELKALLSKLVVDEGNCTRLFLEDVTAAGYVPRPPLLNPITKAPVTTVWKRLTTWSRPVPGTGVGTFQVLLDLGAVPPINQFGGLTITGMSVVPIQQVTTAIASATNSNYAYYLTTELQFTATKNGVKAAAVKTQKGVGVTFRLDTLGNIVSCSGSNPDSIQGVAIPICTPGTMMAYDSVLKQWKCIPI